MARPTDYSPSMLAKAKKYLETLPEGEVVHTIEGLAIALETTRKNIYEWVKRLDATEFRDIVEAIRDMKSFALQNKALRKEVDGGIAKLLLGHEGYRDSQDITSDGKALPTPIMGGVTKDVEP